MASHVIGYVFGNARLLYPRFYLHVAGVLARQGGEYRILLGCTVPFRHPLPCLHGKGQIQGLSGLLHDDTDVPLLARAVHVLPFQRQHIADTQPAIAGEQERALYVFPSARSTDKCLYLVDGQVLTLALRHLDFLVRIQPVYGILADNVFAYRCIQRTTETTEIGNAGKLRQSLSVCTDMGITQEVYEGEAEITVYIPHGGLFVERTEDIYRVADEFAAAPHAFLLLALLVGLHPVQQQHLGALGGVFQPCHAVGQFDNAL